MEIKIKQLKKTVEVKASIKNLKKSYKFAKNMAEAEEKISEGNDELVLDYLDSIIEFVSDIAKLSKKEKEELEMEELMEVVSYIVAKLQGASDSDIKKAKENGEVGLAQESE
ncbi:prophage protein [Lactococcus cremoris subsp. cremoris A76]|uniref:phage tail assembly chaperone n=1 Tax=Lactococcus lactis subsp. cremoris TaxID=1359 RepID=UPI000238D2C4|nr:phage tail assembly chaperone [Lactococcus cremoris]AEU41310.1 prophage protein [Lactococcus cremoris subsp. cremoris A76]